MNRTRWVGTLSCLLVFLPALAYSASLKVTSFPDGAQVWVDGVFTGKLTPMSISLPEGSHSVNVQIPESGWASQTRSVDVVSGNNDLSVTLLPIVLQGEQGTPGLQGPAGAKGDTGEQGLPGVTGAQGPPGTAGAQGPPGPQGLPGQQGVQGFPGVGIQGPPGAQGATGPQGLTGATGPQGPVGPKGDPGPEGLQGANGLPGVQGTKGDPGVQGPAGPVGGSGMMYQYLGASDSNFQGDAGIARLNITCYQKFEATNLGSRMCTSAEMIFTSSNNIPAANGWVIPVLINTSKDFIMDISGVDYDGAVYKGNMSCDGWKSKNDAGIYRGLVYWGGTSEGKFSHEPCGDYYKVLCCGPPQ